MNQETIPETKQCTKCKVEKTLDMFSKSSTRKDGIYPQCKQCVKEYKVLNKEKLSIKNREYRDIHRDIILDNKRKHYHNNQERLNAQNKRYKLLNKDKINDYSKKYYERNRYHILEKCKIYNKINKHRIEEYRRINKDKIKARLQIYYRENKAKIYERTHAYYILNKSKRSEYAIIYRQLNKIKLSIIGSKYRQTKMGKLVSKNYQHKRRSITKMGDVTTVQLADLQHSAKVCYWCKCSLKNVKVHIDHYTPLSKGGEHTISNLVVACPTCNLKKSAKDPLEFANSIGKLL